MATNIKELQEKIHSGSISVSQLVDSYLDNCLKFNHLNAFLEIFEDEAREKAARLDARIKNGEKTGRLAGVVLGIKDNICYKGHRVSASSRILENFESVYNATAIERVLAEDAIILGRLNCDEFAMGGSTENSAYGPALNALNIDKVPGGSSGGAATAVAADMCYAALASDTGGSIRQPAAFCGLVGIKPSYGRVSRYGLIAYGSSFDQIGPITHSVRDNALLMEIIAGKDTRDSTSSRQPVPAYSSSLEFSHKAKIAYLKDPLEHPSLDPEIKTAMLGLIDKLRNEGHEVKGVDFPYLDYIVPTYYVLTMAEASSNLARFDGIHYGYRSPIATDVESTYVKSRSEAFGEEVKRRIMMGTFVLSEGYYDAYYAKAQKVRRLIKEKTEEILSDHEFILLPVTPGPAFDLGKLTDDPIAMYLEDIFTVHASLAGITAISLPLAKHTSGLPLGIQVYAGKFMEHEMFKFSEYLMNMKM
ncbi:MAG: Asp-tRNA(Asn)/Glu-tRNA(Gln) amidotransferase subunit GatA [bacterium]